MCSIEQSLENLQTSYLDLALIHHPWGLVNRGDGEMKPKDESGALQFQQYDLSKSWSGLEQTQRDEKTKAIGLSNFTINQIQGILNTCQIKPANLQLECHAYNQQKKIHEFCTQQGITLTAYSPLGSPDRPAQHRRHDQKELLEEPVIDELAKQYDRTKGNILLRWLIQRGIAVLPKTTSEERLKENLNIFNFEISPDDMERIEELDNGMKYFHFQHYKDHPDFDGSEF